MHKTGCKTCRRAQLPNRLSASILVRREAPPPATRVTPKKTVVTNPVFFIPNETDAAPSLLKRQPKTLKINELDVCQYQRTGSAAEGK